MTAALVMVSLLLLAVVAARLQPWLLFVCLSWLGAAVLVLAGISYVAVMGLCEFDCPSMTSTLTIGMVPMALTWVPLSPAIAMLLRREGQQVRPYGAVPLSIAFCLTAWAIAACAVAWWFGTQLIINGDLAWLAFWLVAGAGWIGLGVLLVRTISYRGRLSSKGG